MLLKLRYGFSCITSLLLPAIGVSWLPLTWAVSELRCVDAYMFYSLIFL